MRIVLDATVLVRAHPRSSSTGRKVLNALIEGRHTLLLSNAILAETTKVLRYPRLQKLYALTDDQLYDYAQFLQEVSETVVIDAAYHAPLRDPNDLDVMQTAERGDADILCKTVTEQVEQSEVHLVGAVRIGGIKAQHMFFVIAPGDAAEDVRFIRNRYFRDVQGGEPEITKVTRLKQQRLILHLCNYRSANPAMMKKLEARARQVAAVCGKPAYVFRDLMHFLGERRIVAPGYSAMQDLVGGALAHEQRRLAAIAHEQVDASAAVSLPTASSFTTPRFFPACWSIKRGSATGGERMR